MVGHVMVFGHEFFADRPERRHRRVRREADMPDRAVGGVAGELDDFLADQCRFPDERRLHVILAQLLQDARALFLVEIDEHDVRIGGFHLQRVGGEVRLAGLGEIIERQP